MLKQLNDIQKSISYNSEVTDELLKTNKLIQEDLKQLKLENSQIKDENKDLRKILEVVKKEMIELKQYSRKLNIEVSNLPESENENISTIIDGLMSAIGLDAKNDLVAYHRVPTVNKNKVKPIIIKFNSAIAISDFITKAKVKKITADQINSCLTAVPVYFNDHLCPELKRLFYQCKMFKTENHFKFCWTKSGKIYLRKSDGSKIYCISCESDLLNVPK